MTAALAAFDLVGDMLPDQTGNKNYPAVVPGRIAHIDADFTAYMIACDTVDETQGVKPLRSFRYKCEQVEDIARSIARSAGAESYVMHITPTGSDKGGRRDQAVQAEYQASRGDKDPPEHLSPLRGYIGTAMPSGIHLDQEADDGMAQAAYDDPGNVVVCSKDKDLLMVPGWHLDMNTYALWWQDPKDYGSLSVKVDKNGKNSGITGRGPMWFFAQCLMGDAADTIKGLPSVAPEFWSAVAPTKAIVAAIDSGSVEKYRKALAAAPHKPCGPMLTFDLLKHTTSIKEGFEVVRQLFLAAGEHKPFTHWKTGEFVTPTRALFGDMQCLWMRRNKNPNDVLAWLKENV